MEADLVQLIRDAVGVAEPWTLEAVRQWLAFKTVQSSLWLSVGLFSLAAIAALFPWVWIKAPWDEDSKTIITALLALPASMLGLMVAFNVETLIAVTWFPDAYILSELLAATK